MGVMLNSDAGKQSKPNKNQAADGRMYMTNLGRKSLPTYSNFVSILERKQASIGFISGILLILPVLLFISGRVDILSDFQEIGYLLFAIPIIYATISYGKGFGLLVAGSSLPLWLLGTVERCIRKFGEGDMGDILVEGLAWPLVYFLICVGFGRLVLRERELMVKYKTAAAQLSIQNQSLMTYHIKFIKTLTKVIDAKDNYTKGHSQRVACYALALAQKLDLKHEEQRDIFYGAVLHDLGKIGVKESILTKPSVLSDQEYLEIKDHPSIGAEILDEIDAMGKIKQMILIHHERCDGSGYPFGLTGEQISLGAKIIGVVDSYDAMVSQRSYSKTLDKKAAILELQRCAGTKFDSDIVEIFIELLDHNDIEVDFNKCLDEVTQ